MDVHLLKIRTKQEASLGTNGHSRPAAAAQTTEKDIADPVQGAYGSASPHPDPRSRCRGAPSICCSPGAVGQTGIRRDRTPRISHKSDDGGSECAHALWGIAGRKDGADHR